MANNVLIMEEDDADEFGRKSNGVYNKSSETRDNVGKNLRGMTDAGVGTKPSKAVQTQLNIIGEKTERIGKMVVKHTHDVFDFDRSMAKVVSELEMPKDFLAENVVEVNQYNRTLLGKIDGDKTVGEGEEAQEFSEIDESVIAAEGLVDITGENAKEEEYDDDSAIKGQSKLGNIKKGETEEEEYDDSSSVKQSGLRNIVNAGTTQQELNAESSIQGQSNLGNIGQFKSTKEQEYDDDSSIDEEQKMDVAENQKSAKEQEELEKKMMAAAYDNFAATEFQEEMKKKAEDELEHVDYNEFENTN